MAPTRGRGQRPGRALRSRCGGRRGRRAARWRPGPGLERAAPARCSPLGSCRPFRVLLATLKKPKFFPACGYSPKRLSWEHTQRWEPLGSAVMISASTFILFHIYFISTLSFNPEELLFLFFFNVFAVYFSIRTTTVKQNICKLHNCSGLETSVQTALFVGVHNISARK